MRKNHNIQKSQCSIILWQHAFSQCKLRNSFTSQLAQCYVHKILLFACNTYIYWGKYILIYFRHWPTLPGAILPCLLFLRYPRTSRLLITGIIFSPNLNSVKLHNFRLVTEVFYKTRKCDIAMHCNLRPPDAEPVMSALTETPGGEVWSSSTYQLLSYSVCTADTLLYAVAFDPLTLTFDLERL